MTTRMLPVALIFILLVMGATAQQPSVLAADSDSKAALRKELDTYLDGRWLPKDEADKATLDMLHKLKDAGCTVEEVEEMIRAGRAEYPKGLQAKTLDVETKGPAETQVQVPHGVRSSASTSTTRRPSFCISPSRTTRRRRRRCFWSATAATTP